VSQGIRNDGPAVAVADHEETSTSAMGNEVLKVRRERFAGFQARRVTIGGRPFESLKRYVGPEGFPDSRA
jgi:hypothetical protein